MLKQTIQTRADVSFADCVGQRHNCNELHICIANIVNSSNIRRITISDKFLSQSLNQRSKVKQYFLTLWQTTARPKQLFENFETLQRCCIIFQFAIKVKPTWISVLILISLQEISLNNSRIWSQKQVGRTCWCDLPPCFSIRNSIKTKLNDCNTNGRYHF